MAGRYVSRVYSRSNTTLFRKAPFAMPSIQISRGLATTTVKITGIDEEFDGKHWFVKVKKPDDNLTRDQIIDSYIKILATVLGSEEEARMKIYSVSTRHYYAIGALVDEEICSKLRELPEVEDVGPDSYINAKEKDYGGEPFIEGRPVPYDRKYHAAYWRLQEGRVLLPTQMDGPRATNSVLPDKELSSPRAWLSRAVAWWKGPILS